MGLSFISYISAAFMLSFGLRLKGRRSVSGFFRIALIASALAAAGQANAYILAESHLFLALIFARISVFMIFIAFLSYLFIAIAYPDTKSTIVLYLVFVLSGLIALWFCVGTNACLDSIIWHRPELVYREGPFYSVILNIVALTGIVAVLFLIVKAIITKNRVFRQKYIILAFAILLSIAGVYSIMSNAFYGILAFLNPLYPVSASSLVFAAIAAVYVYRTTRIFQPAHAIKTIAIWFLLAVIFAVPAAVISGTGFIFEKTAPWLSGIIALSAFLVAARSAESFAVKRFGAEKDEAAREDLAAAIAHIDMSSGREVALASLSSLLIQAFGASWLLCMTEDDNANIRKTWPEEGKLVLAHDSSALDALLQLDRQIVFLTDVMSDEYFLKVRPEISAFMNSLGAAVLIMAREGRRLIGIFALGSKKSGADYDERDYATLEAVHGKLFVLAYYARHIERESLLTTVEQEIGLADQIIKSVHDNIDVIEHPAVIMSRRCLSSMGLGGDIFDTVKLSDQRWFMVIGDISGKGLNASMSMIILKSMIRTLIAEEKNFTNFISRINLFIKDRLPRGTFFSGLFAFLAIDKGSLYYINCGIPAMLYSSPGLDSVVETQGEGKMLGFVRDIKPHIKTKKLVLAPGSRLLISTDGIIETESIKGERYSKERLVRILVENRTSSAEETVEAVIRSANAFTGGKLEDDITLAIIDYKGIAKKEKKS